MQSGQQETEFDIDEARRVLADVFAPWVQDLGLSISQLDYTRPADAAADWQPGAICAWAFPSACAGTAALCAVRR